MRRSIVLAALLRTRVTVAVFAVGTFAVHIAGAAFRLETRTRRLDIFFRGVGLRVSLRLRRACENMKHARCGLDAPDAARAV